MYIYTQADPALTCFAYRTIYEANGKPKSRQTNTWRDQKVQHNTQTYSVYGIVQVQ
jgi:hypothetical protein